MKSSAVLLSAIAAVLFVASAHAQDSTSTNAGKRKGSDSMLGSEKKTPVTPTADASQPESKLGSNTKIKSKTPVDADGTKAGPYGVGLKKVPRAKSPKTQPPSEASPN